MATAIEKPQVFVSNVPGGWREPDIKRFIKEVVGLPKPLNVRVKPSRSGIRNFGIVILQTAAEQEQYLVQGRFMWPDKHPDTIETAKKNAVKRKIDEADL